MINIPEVRLGLLAVSRNCFPASLSRSRRDAVAAEMHKLGLTPYVAQTIVETETDAVEALRELRGANVNALLLYLGNFGPEGPETYIAAEFSGPVMVAAAAEEADALDGRGDAFCGLLNCSYNLGLRGTRAYIPENPVGLPAEIAARAGEFIPIAKALIGLKSLKVISFGPRPQDFLACNAPIKPLYDIGVTVMENSELDLYVEYKAHEGDGRIEAVAQDMARELGDSCAYAGVLPRLAQFELTLIDYYEKNLGYCDHAVFANKCWPAFQTEFKFVPCFVNSRLTARGIPVSCEVDIYGAVSEYIITCVTGIPATLLDINNTVPPGRIKLDEIKPYKPSDLFMGFHCGNTPSCHLRKAEMSYQRIMKRSLEPDGEPDITRGTLEGALRAGDVTVFRLQSNASGKLMSYAAEGEVLTMDPQSFGGIGVIAVPELARFYRHVLVEGQYPHHAAIAFKRSGRALFEVVKALGVQDFGFNRPAGNLYPGENPFA